MIFIFFLGGGGGGGGWGGGWYEDFVVKGLIWGSFFRSMYRMGIFLGVAKYSNIFEGRLCLIFQIYLFRGDRGKMIHFFKYFYPAFMTGYILLLLDV